MNTIRRNINKIKERPAMLVFLAAVTLLTSILEQYNSFTKAHGSISLLLKGNLLNTLCELAEKTDTLFRTPKLFWLLFLTALLFMIALSAILGISYSGFFHQMLLSATERERHGKEIRTGIGRHAMQISVYFFAILASSLLFLFLLGFTLIPAILTVGLFFTGASGIFFPMLLICILTLAVDFFAILFYTMYMTFAIPSLVCFKRGGFGVSCRMVNGYCWYLLPRALLFLLLNLLLRAGLLAVHYGAGGITGLAVLLVTWIIRTVFYFTYLSFAFDTFAAMKNDMFGEE